MPLRDRLDGWSDIGMKLTIAVVNAVKICLLIVVVYFLIKIGFAAEYWVHKVADTLPTWPVR